MSRDITLTYYKIILLIRLPTPAARCMCDGLAVAAVAVGGRRTVRAAPKWGDAQRIACRHLPKSAHQCIAAAVVGALSVCSKVSRARWSQRGLVRETSDDRDIRQENNAGRSKILYNI